jgi:hypothetical protein
MRITQTNVYTVRVSSSQVRQRKEEAMTLCQKDNTQYIADLARELVNSDFDAVDYSFGDPETICCMCCDAEIPMKYEHGIMVTRKKELQHKEPCLWAKLKYVIDEEKDESR